MTAREHRGEEEEGRSRKHAGALQEDGRGGAVSTWEHCGEEEEEGRAASTREHCGSTAGGRKGRSRKHAGELRTYDPCQVCLELVRAGSFSGQTSFRFVARRGL